MRRLHQGAEAQVNSYHHQSIDLTGRNLRIVAVAPDDVIEAVEDTTGKFLIGVQWHPETGWSSDQFARSLFKAFVGVAREVR